MNTRAHVHKKAAFSSIKKAATSKAFQPRPFAREAQPKLASGPIGQRQGNLLGGIQVSQRTTIRAKLTIGEPGDKYEREADRVAEAVMNAPTSAPAQTPAASITPIAASHSAAVQASADDKASAADGNLENLLNLSNSGGSPLPQHVRDFMEPRFGVDLSSVRVHTDTSAVQMNQQLGARAFTYANHIYYGAGNSPSNDPLTAHELTHVQQQTGIATPPQTQSAPPASSSVSVQRDYGLA